MSVDASRRAYLGLARGVVMGSDDSKKMQLIDARGFQGEYFKAVERPQSYGFKSVPVDPDENGGKASEVVIGFINGNRAHPIVLAEGDRRTYPTNWEKGESGLWHHKGATAKLTATGWKHDAGPEKQPHTVTVGNCTATWMDKKALVRVGSPSDPAVVVNADGVWLGGDPDVLGRGAFDLVLLVSGPAKNVYGLKG